MPPTYDRRIPGNYSCTSLPPCSPNRLAEEAGAPNAGVDMKGEGDAPKPPAAALLAVPNKDGVEAAPNAGVLAPPTGACTQGEGAAVQHPKVQRQAQEPQTASPSEGLQQHGQCSPSQS